MSYSAIISNVVSCVSNFAMQRGGSVITAIFHPVLLTLTNLFGGEPVNAAIRASTGTWIDDTGIVKTAQVNEPRIAGSREVRNLVSFSEDFSNAAWLKSSASVVGTNLVILPAAYARIYQNFPISNAINMGILAILSGSGTVTIKNLSNTIRQQVTLSTVPQTFYATGALNPASTTETAHIWRDPADTATQVTVHALMAVTGMPANYVPEYVAKDNAAGAELVTNGGFDTDTWWVKYNGATISGGVASLPVLNAYVSEPGIYTIGKRYVFDFTVVSGSCKTYLAGVYQGILTAGTYRRVVTATSTVSSFYYGYGPAIVDTISAHEASTGRQLFDTESGNTVLNNVVTESTLTHNAGKTSLVNEHGWIITDGGLA